MKIWYPNLPQRTTRWQMSIAFITGMVITASLAQTPAAAHIFPIQPMPATPIMKDSQHPPEFNHTFDILIPEKPYMNDPVGGGEEALSFLV